MYDFLTPWLWGLQSSRKWPRVVWKMCINVSEKCSASIFKVSLKHVFTRVILHRVRPQKTVMSIFTAVGVWNVYTVTKFVNFKHTQYPISIDRYRYLIAAFYFVSLPRPVPFVCHLRLHCAILKRFFRLCDLVMKCLAASDRVLSIDRTRFKVEQFGTGGEDGTAYLPLRVLWKRLRHTKFLWRPI